MEKRAAIVPVDRLVLIDDFNINIDIDLPGVHAVQIDLAAGTAVVEMTDAETENITIDDLTPYLPLLDKCRAARVKFEAEVQAAENAGE